MMIPSHTVKTRTVHSFGIKIGFGPYHRVKLNRTKSYWAMKKWYAGKHREGAAIVCTMLAGGGVLAVGSCLLLVLKGGTDAANMFRGVKSSHHRCARITAYALSVSNAVLDNFLAPPCTRSG